MQRSVETQIAGPARTEGSSNGPAPVKKKKGRWGRRLRWAGVVLLAAAIAAFFLLPRWIERRLGPDRLLALLRDQGYEARLGGFEVRLLPRLHVRIRNLEGKPRDPASGRPSFELSEARLTAPFSELIRGLPTTITLVDPRAVIRFPDLPSAAGPRASPPPPTPPPARKPDAGPGERGAAPDGAASKKKGKPPLSLEILNGTVEVVRSGSPLVRLMNARTRLDLSPGLLRAQSDIEAVWEGQTVKVTVGGRIAGHDPARDPFDLNLRIKLDQAGGWNGFWAGEDGRTGDLFWDNGGTLMVRMERLRGSRAVRIAGEAELKKVEVGLKGPAGPDIRPWGDLRLRFEGASETDGLSFLLDRLEVGSRALRFVASGGRLERDAQGRLTRARLAVESLRLNLTDAARFVPLPPGFLAEGAVTASGEVTVTPGGFEGRLRADLGAVSLNGFGLFLKEKGKELRVEGGFRKEGETLRADGLTLTGDGLDGKMETCALTPDRMDIEGLAGTIRLGKDAAVRFLEGRLPPMQGEIQLRRLALHAREGAPLDIEGSVTLSGVEIIPGNDLPPLPRLDGLVVLKDGSASVEAALRAEGIKAEVVGSLSPLSGLLLDAPDFEADLAIHGDKLDVEALVLAGGAAAGEPGAPPPAPGLKTPPGGNSDIAEAPAPAPAPVPGAPVPAVPAAPSPAGIESPWKTWAAAKVRLSIVFKEIAWGRCRATDLDAALRIRDGTLAVEHLKAAVNDGSLEATRAEWEFARPRGAIHVAVRIENVSLKNEAWSVLRYAVPLGSGSRGRAVGKVELTSAGFSIGEIRSGLTGTGELAVDDLDIGASDLMKVREIRESLEVLGSEKFRRIESSFKVGEEKVETDVKLLGEKLDFGLKGPMGFDGSLDLEPYLNYHPQEGEEDRLKELQAKSKLRLRIRGTVKKPRVEVEMYPE